MAEKPVYRIELSPSAFAIIEAEAYLTGKTLKALASEMVEKHCSQNAIKFAQLKGSNVERPKDVSAIRDKNPEKQKVEEPERGAVTASGPKPKHKSLAKDPVLSARVLELSAQGMKPTAISKETGVPASTIRDFLKRSKEAGEGQAGPGPVGQLQT